MKLVLTYWVGDGCSYGFSQSIPVEYSSAEEFEQDLLAVFEESEGLSVIMANREFSQDVYQALQTGEYQVMAVDDWFDSYEGVI